MPSEIIEIWNIAKEIIKDIAIYIMPIAAVLVSVISCEYGIEKQTCFK